MTPVSKRNTPPAPELIRPIYFRNEDKYLFGCHHLPSIKTKSRGAVVLCPGCGDEYYYSHRTLRQLASQLARAGFHVLRFDYFGTGDSEGDDESATMVQWRVDVGSAIDEIKRLSRSDRASVIGIRLGATLAGQVSLERSDIDNLVLWNPLLTGADLLEPWMEIQSNHNRALGFTPDSPRLAEFMGISLSSKLLDELEALSLPPLHGAKERILVLVNQKTEAINNFVEAGKEMGNNISLEKADDPKVWQQNNLESVVASKSLKTILQWFGTEND